MVITTQNLVEQQATTIDTYTNLVVGHYHGGQNKSSSIFTSIRSWKREMAVQDVMVIMAKKFYDLLMHGFIAMDQIDLLIFDECHHADSDHPYNLIMRDFFYHDFDPYAPFATKRPKIIGLTASPIKQKIESDISGGKIEDLLQNLANNLFCKYVTRSKEELQKLSSGLKVDIHPYSNDFGLTQRYL